MLVHSPEAYPEVEGNTLAVGPGQEMFISVEASHTEGLVNRTMVNNRRRMRIRDAAACLLFLNLYTLAGSEDRSIEYTAPSPG